jgi:serine/threonine protein kinase
VVHGTPATMAPEWLFGAPASVGSEVYELALLLYQMLVGRLAWGESADAEARLVIASPAEAGGQPLCRRR